MPLELWKLPLPVTALFRGPFFSQLPRRRCEISFEIEGCDGALSKIVLAFEGVEAYKCTYMTSLSAHMITMAYGKVVRVDESSWIDEISKIYDKGSRAHKNLQHLITCFDDGPCYEFICLQFSVVNMDE
jgi:hypothetical protein